jgi:hypothetical protein
LEIIREIPRSLNNWVHVRIIKSHKKYELVGRIKSYENVGIFVIYPGTSPLPSVKRIIMSLQKANYSVVLVINTNDKYPMLNLLQLQKKCLILLRKNIGADFGGYRAAIEYLESTSHYSKIKHLALINDSIYVTPKSQKSINEILNPKTPSNCIFFHRQTVEHAASMCLLFKDSTIQSRPFRNFWKFYYPYSSKRKIIRKGEHKLSKIIGSENFKPYIDINSLNNTKLKSFLPEEVIQVVDWSERTSISAAKFIKLKLSHEKFLDVFSYSVFNLHVSNSLGLYVNRVLNVPLKMDLVKLGLVTMSEFLDRASKSGVKKEEVKELKLILEKRGSHLTVSRMRSLLRP